MQLDPEALGLLLVAADRVVDHLGEVDLGVVHAEVGAVHPREVEQVADEPLEPPRLGGDGRRRFSRVHGAVLDRLGIAADRGERRLQLVADREEEVPLGLLRLPELRGELVEGAGERRDLGCTLDRHRLWMRAAREAPGRGRDAADRTRDAAREQERGECGEEAAGRSRDEESPDVRRQERDADAAGG